jgi:hypothetical protein
MAINITLNHEQDRLYYDRLSVIAAGADFRAVPNENVWTDPVKDVTMLRPAPLLPGWATSNSGIYQKFQKSDYTFADASQWENRYDQSMKGPWVSTIDSNYNAIATLTTPPGVNRGMYVSWYSYGEGSEFLQFECGWENDAGNPELGLYFRFWSSGRVEIFENGAIITEGSYSGSSSGQNQTKQVVQVLILPWCVREILIYSISAGAGFSYVLEDADPETNTVITPDTQFWWRVTSGATQVMCAKLRYPTSGYATSYLRSFFEAPTNTDTLETWDNDAWVSDTDCKIYSDSPLYGTFGLSSSLRAPNTTDAFTANSSNVECKIKVDFTGDSYCTPFLYGAQYAYNLVTEQTNGTESVELIDQVLSLSFSVGEGAEETTMEFELVDPELVQESAPNFMAQSNLPVKMELDGILWLDGRSNPMKTEYNTTPESTVARCEIADQWKSLEKYTLVEPYPIDDLLFTDVIEKLVSFCGMPVADIEISTSTYRFPRGVGKKAGEWNEVIPAGASAGDWVSRLFSDYAPTWIYGFKPVEDKIIFYAVSPDDYSTTADVVLYKDIATAISVGLHDPEDAWMYVWNEFQPSPIEVEGNDIRVIGGDPVTGVPKHAYKPYVDSIDPTILPSLRDANWVGEIRRVSLYNNSLTRQADVNSVCEIFGDRVSALVSVAEFSCHLLRFPSKVPLWKGDVVELYQRGKYRIVSFGVDFQLVEDEYQILEAKYVGEKI